MCCNWRFERSYCLKMSGTVYPATQLSNPEEVNLRAFCITCIVIFYNGAIFLTIWLLPVFLLKTFRLVSYTINRMVILLNYGRQNGGKENTVLVTAKRSILFRLKTLVHESKTVLNTKKIWASGLYLDFSLTCLFQTLRQSTIWIFSNTVYLRLRS